jgi:hypothetical protein
MGDRRRWVTVAELDRDTLDVGGQAGRDGTDRSVGIDMQSFIDQATGQPCEMCGGEGTVSDEGLRYGSQQCIDVICPECDGQGLMWDNA